MDNYSLYGLPENVQHCKSCLMTNQKPLSVNETKSKKSAAKAGMKINKAGICDACLYSQKKKEQIDWKNREKLLLAKLDKFRRLDGQYDCIVSGSGGKDSIMVSHLLKYKYGMHPLTITYAPLLYTEVGMRNMQNWINVERCSACVYNTKYYMLYHVIQILCFIKFRKNLKKENCQKHFSY